MVLSLFCAQSIYARNDSPYDLTKYFKANQFETIFRICQPTIKGKDDDLSCLYYLSLINFAQKKTDIANKYVDSFKESFKKKAIVSGSAEKGMLVFLEKDMGIDQFQFIDIYYYFAKKNIGQKNCKEALYWLNAAKHPTNQDEFYLGYQGYCNYEYKRYEVARNYYIQLATLFPENYIALVSIDATYAKENNLKQAIIWLEKAIKASDKTIPILRDDEDKDFSNIRGSKEYQKLIGNPK